MSIALSKITLLDRLKIDALTWLLELIDKLLSVSCGLLIFICDFFSFLLFFFLLFFIIACHLIKLFFDLLDPCEGEVVLGSIFQFGDVVLDVEHGEIRRGLNKDRKVNVSYHMKVALYLHKPVGS